MESINVTIKSLVCNISNQSFIVIDNPRLVNFNEIELVHTVRGQANLSLFNKASCCAEDPFKEHTRCRDNFFIAYCASSVV